MKKLAKAISTLFFLLLLMASKLYAQNSNIGTEFWTGYMDHINPPGTTGSQMILYIASDVGTKVTVSITDNSFSAITANVLPNVITSVAIPASAFLGDIQGVSSKGIHILSDNAIAVYAHIYRDNVSGATLLLPVNTLATDYYSLNYKQISNQNTAYSTFMIVATEDGTTVKITPSAKLINGEAANADYNITLNKGQIYQGLSLTDLSGTKISSVSTGNGCKRIAVFSGSSKISIGKSSAITSLKGSADNLIQQVYPTASWGKNFITVPLKSRSYDIFRVAVSDTTAIVTLNGVTMSGLVNKFYYEFASQDINIIKSDKPIQVVQYAVTQYEKFDGTNDNKDGDVGDPEMIYLNPIEQNIDHVTLYSTSKAAINPKLNFINVLIPTKAVSSFLLDGNFPAGSFAPVPADNTYSYGQLLVSTGATHVISASQGFNAIAYGFGSAESYGYAAGTNVKNLNEYVQFFNTATNTTTATGCAGSTYIPQVVIPYPTDTITWDLGNGASPVKQIKPNYKDTITRNNVKLYVYDYGKPLEYQAGTYAIKVTVIDPITTLCGSNEEIYLNYVVSDVPVAKITSRDTVCTADTIGFKGTANIAVKTWHWDFGNGDTSAVQNPVYHFLQSGWHTVTLIAAGATGCTTAIQKNIYARVLPVADFDVPDPICDSPLTVTFIDRSVASEGKITSWLWDFGDGSISTKNDGSAFTHTYTSAQSYTVTLTVITDKSCIASKPKVKTVNFSSNVDFTMPDACQYDYYVNFTSLSSVKDSVSNNLSYLWDFGDATGTATGKSVKHHYVNPGKYDVRLTVTTAYGCVRDTVKQLTINGGSPKAAFTVLHKDSLCSNQPVLFETQAYVKDFNGGKVNSFTIDFGDQTPVQTFRLDSGTIFTHKYPTEFVKPATLYQVTMIAHSGSNIKCSDLVSENITILSVPKIVTFNPPQEICLNANPLQLSSYVRSQAGGPAATPSFTIDGAVSANGIFNPAVLGVGAHTVRCYDVADDTQCADTSSVKTIIVEPIATVDAGPVVNVLAGGQVQLKASIKGGDHNKITWSPTTGLTNPTIQNPYASPKITTLYTLTVTSTTDTLACPVSDTVTVNVLQAPVIPNTFTPNGDSRNDVWEIKYLNTYPGCTVEVYNRNGEKVFYSIGYGIPWDGQYNSVNLPVGTYYYIIDPKSGRSKISGSVTIIR